MQTMSPAELLQTLLQRASASGPAVAGQNPTTPPPLAAATPLAQAPAPPPPAPSSGSRFGEILKALAPAIFANVAAVQGGPLAAAGVLKGYSQAQQQKREQAEQQAALDAANAKYQDEQNIKAAAVRQAAIERAMKFKQDAIAQLPTYTHPADRAAFIQSREQDAQTAFGIPPGWLSGLPPLDTHAQDQKHAQDFITQMIKLHGVKGFNDLVANDSIIQNYYGDGRSARAQDIWALSGWDVIDPTTGKPMTLPQADVLPNNTASNALINIRLRTFQKQQGRPATDDERSRIILQAEQDSARARQSNAAGASGQSLDDVPVLSPHVSDYKIAQQLAYGDLTWSQFTRLFAYQHASSTEKKAIYNTAMQLNPHFSPAKLDAGFKFATNPGVRKQLAALDNVTAAANDLLKFSEGASRSRWPTLNKVIIRGGLLAGDTKYSNFLGAATAFADELSGALGFGNATDMSRQMGLKMTDWSLSQDQFSHDIRDVVLPFIQRKRDSLVPVGSPEAMYAPQPSGSATQAPTLSPPRQIRGYTVQVEQ
ncbi:MAG TPA: hypothetical protein VG538_11450 [Vicinamibacterales bacterium]|jgi:hypothetical protein|nr:hypothetical protein [Vicinamibacterales bacterium]